MDICIGTAVEGVFTDPITRWIDIQRALCMNERAVEVFSHMLTLSLVNVCECENLLIFLFFSIDIVQIIIHYNGLLHNCFDKLLICLLFYRELLPIMYDTDSIRHADCHRNVSHRCWHFLQHHVPWCITYHHHVRSSISLPIVLD